MPNNKKSGSLTRYKKPSEKRAITKRRDIGAKPTISKPAKIETGDPLTKKILIKAASEGFSIAAAKTMEVMGYNVISKDGWVVKIFPDGSIEKISKLDSHTNKKVFLD